MNSRQIEIVRDFSINDKLSVSWLANRHGVSQVTIRSDLRKLEKEGLLTRNHGGASATAEEKLDNRLTHHFATKKRIAAAAAELINSGETIMIESGSTGALLARTLGESKDVTIITNSAFIANYVRDLPRVKIIMLGGDYQNGSEVCVGPLTKLALESFLVDKLFFGTDGYSEQGGFTSDNLLRAEIVCAMAERAKEAILISDSSKFQDKNRRGNVSGLSLQATTKIVSDDAMPPHAQALFKNYDIELILVNSE